MSDRLYRQPEIADEDAAERGGSDRQHPLSPANERPLDYKPGKRKCLSCGTLFPSEWSGERICKKCKASHNWRTGLA